MPNAFVDLANLAKYKLSNAAIRAKHLNGFLQSQMTITTAPSGAQFPKINMRLQAALEREDMNLATVVRIMGDAFKWLPLKVKTIDTDADGNQILSDDNDHPFNDLWREPNTWHATSEIQTHILASKLLTGNSFIRIKTIPGRLLNSSGVSSLWPAPPWTMLVNRDDDGMPIGYVQNKGTKHEAKLGLDEVIHHRAYNINDPIYGRSGLEPAKRLLWAEYQAEMMLVSFFSNDGTPRSVLSPAQSVTPEQQKMIEEFYKNRTDPNDKNRLHILPIAGEFINVQPSMKDMEFQNMRNFHREKIFGLLGIPPTMAGVQEFATYANALIQEASFWRNAMKPMVMSIADVLTRQVLWVIWPDGMRTKLEYDLSGVEALQRDQLKKAQTAFRLSGGKPIMSVNEIRAKEYGLEPVEGGDDMTPVRSIGQRQEAVNEPADAKMVEVKTRNSDWEVIDTKMVDAARHEAIWKAFDHMATEKEPLIRSGLKKYWKGQEDRVITRLRAVTVEGLAMSNLFAHVRTKVGDLDDFMDLRLEDELMAKFFEPIILDIVGDIGDNEVGEIRAVAPSGVSVAFDVDNPEVRIMVEQLTNRITLTNQRTFKDIRRILKQGFDQRLSVDEVAKLINRKYAEYNLARAKTIARTEMTGIANGASNKAWAQNGATHKTWLATLDPVTRDFHTEYHGERVLINGLFKFGPEPMDYPASPMATLPGNVINCRCALEYDFDPLTEAEIQDLELQESNS